MAPVSVKKDLSQEIRKKVRIRGSKHKKKSWRKDSNIKDVEEFLDEKRRIDRIRSRAQRTDDDLISVTRKIRKLGKSSLKEHEVSTFTTRYSCLATEPVDKQSDSKKVKKITRNPIKKAKLKVLEKKPVSSNIKKKHVLSLLKPIGDLWKDDEERFDNEYLKEANDYFKQQTRKTRISRPSRVFLKPSTLPAIEVPHPGASYNPVFEDHQELLSKAREIELKKEKEEKHLNRVLTDKFPTLANAPSEATWLKEMSQGISKEDDESDSEPENLDLDTISLNPPTLNNKKTRSKRNKEMRQKQLEEKFRKEKAERKRENEVFKIKSYLKTINKKEKRAKIRRSSRIKRNIEKMAKPMRMGRLKFEEQDLELALSTELRGTLRQMKPMGSLLQDRLKSFQRRNIIEPTARRKVQRKYKLKKFVKKSHKEE